MNKMNPDSNDFQESHIDRCQDCRRVYESGASLDLNECKIFIDEIDEYESLDDGDEERESEGSDSMSRSKEYLDRVSNN